MKIDNVVAHLDETPCALEDHLRNLDVGLERHVGGRGEDLAAGDAPLPVGDLLWSLVHQQDEDGGIGVVDGDGVRHLLQEGRLAGLRW